MDISKQKKISLIALIFGYIDLALALIAAISTTMYFIKDARQNIINDGGQVIGIVLVILWIAVVGISFFVTISAIYAILLGIKAAKIDNNFSKRTKAIDIATIVVSLIGAIAGAIVLIISNSKGSSDTTYIALMVVIDIVFLMILTSIINNTIDFVKAKKTIFLEKKADSKAN